MSLESGDYIADLNAANPGGSDDYSTADDHLRLIKHVLKTQFPNLGSAVVTPTAAELSKLTGFTGAVADLNVVAGAAAAGLTPTEFAFLNGVTSNLQTQLNARVVNTRQVLAGNGLTGGGALSADVTLNVNAGNGLTVVSDSLQLDTAHARNADHAGITITAGAGLTGGGTIDASRTLDVGAGNGITVAADAVQLDTTNSRNVDHSAISVIAGAGLQGGGAINASRTLDVVGISGIQVNTDSVQLDLGAVWNVSHAAVSISAGEGLSGGGTIQASRTLNLATNLLTDYGAIPSRTMSMPIYNGSAMRRIDIGDLRRIGTRTVATSANTQLDDGGSVVRFTGGSAQTYTVLPHSSVNHPAGTVIVLERGTAGTVTVAEGSGVDVRSPDGRLELRAQYSQATLRCITTNVWILGGDLA